MEPVVKPSTPVDPLAVLADKVSVLTKGLDTLVEKSNKPNYAGSSIPAAVIGGFSKDSQPYSFLAAAAFSRGQLPAEKAKYEIECSKQLKDLYGGHVGNKYGEGSILVPITRDLPLADCNDTQHRFFYEMKQKMMGYSYDPDEAKSITDKGGPGGVGGQWMRTKAALNTFTDPTAGVLTGFPTLSPDFIDLLRYLEVFSRLGARQVPSPVNGRLSLNKQAGGATAYWVGEDDYITESQPRFANLELQVKKLAVLVKMTNELARFTGGTAENLIRADMAAVASREADRAMFYGTGGTQIKGLLTYPTATSWVLNQDYLLDYAGSGFAKNIGANGNTFEPEDVQLMESILPDEVIDGTNWVFRRSLYAALRNRRADAAVAADEAGAFMFERNRSGDEKVSYTLNGTPVIYSSQVSASQIKGSGTNLTDVVLGNFPDWMIMRMGVMELVSNGYGDADFRNDRTSLRAIQHIDAGPRRLSSFVWYKQLLQT